MITHSAIVTHRSVGARSAQSYAEGGRVVLDLNETGSVLRVDAPSAKNLIRLLELAVADIEEER